MIGTLFLYEWVSVSLYEKPTFPLGDTIFLSRGNHIFWWAPLWTLWFPVLIRFHLLNLRKSGGRFLFWVEANFSFNNNPWPFSPWVKFAFALNGSYLCFELKLVLVTEEATLICWNLFFTWLVDHFAWNKSNFSLE